MNFPFAFIDPNLLSVTGVIATILAVIFGIGAYTNSRSRKKHMMELEKVQRQDQAMHFRPAKSHRPGRSALPSRSSLPKISSSPRESSPRASSPRASSRRGSTPRPAPIAKSSTPPDKMVEPKKSEKPVLFRKVRPDGLEQQVDAAPDEDKEKYLWE